MTSLDISSLHTDWNLAENNQMLSRHIELTNFIQALDLVNKIGNLAENQNHHPDINFGWGYVEIYLTTHDIGQVSDKDISLAKAIDVLLS